MRREASEDEIRAVEAEQREGQVKTTSIEITWIGLSDPETVRVMTERWAQGLTSAGFTYGVIEAKAVLEPQPPSDRTPTGRELLLAAWLGWLMFPGAGTFDNLTQAERDACFAAAKIALETAEAARKETP